MKLNTRCVCHISNTPPESLLERIKWVLAMIAMLGTHVQTYKQLENMRKEGKPCGKKTPPQKENLTVILLCACCKFVMQQSACMICYACMIFFACMICGT